MHETDQTELIPPSCFTESTKDITDASLSNRLHRPDIADSSTTPCRSAPEKRPTFAFHRYIRDHLDSFTYELPDSPMQYYTAVVKSVGGAIHDLVQEWTEGWLAGVNARGGADTEARLAGMMEEVVWGNVIWYGIGGWASRGTGGRGLNPDFFL